MERLMCGEWIAEIAEINDRLAILQIKLRNLNRSGQEDSSKALYYHSRIKSLRTRKIVLEQRIKEKTE